MLYPDAMPVIRTTLEPWRDVLVTDTEYLGLLRIGLIYEGAPVQPPPSFTDAQYAELANPEGEAAKRVLAAALALVNVDAVAASVATTALATIEPEVEAMTTAASATLDGKVSLAQAARDQAEAWAAGTEALQGEAVETLMGRAEGVVYPEGIALGVLTHASLQAAADLAFSTSDARKSVSVIAAGVLTTDQTVLLRSDADLSGLQINYTGTGVAFQLGTDSALLQNVTVRCPKLINSRNTVGQQWANVPGTVGMRAINVSQSTVYITYVGQFETGFLVDARNNQAHAYSTYHIGMLYNNKRNLVMGNDGLGWTTQNTFIGGRFAHASAEGSAVVGCEQIYVEPTMNPSRNATSNNVFINPSVEGIAPQYHLSIAGRYNIIINPRLEVGDGGNARVRYHDGARYNQIIGGYGSHAITYTIEGDSASNLMYGIRTQTYVGGDSAPAIAIEKAGLSTSYQSGYPAGWLASNGLFSEWLWNITGRGIAGKQAADAFARAEVIWYDGEFRVGDGTVAAPMGFRAHVNGIQFFGGSLVMPPAYDIGVGSQIPARIRLGVGVVIPAFASGARPTPEEGLTIRDATTHKMLTYSGGAWRDAMGTAV